MEVRLPALFFCRDPHWARGSASRKGLNEFLRDRDVRGQFVDRVLIHGYQSFLTDKWKTDWKRGHQVDGYQSFLTDSQGNGRGRQSKRPQSAAFRYSLGVQ